MDSEVSPPFQEAQCGWRGIRGPVDPKLQARTGREKQWLPPNCLGQCCLLPAWSGAWIGRAPPQPRSGFPEKGQRLSTRQPRTATAAGRQAGPPAAAARDEPPTHPPMHQNRPEPADRP